MSLNAQPRRDFPPKKEPEKPLIDAEFLKVAQSLAERAETLRLSIDDGYFSNIPNKEREWDKQRTARMRTQNAERETPELRDLGIVAKAMECVVVERINKSHWLGQDVRATLTTDVDDIYNGIDLYVEKITEGKPVGLSLDVTYTKDATQLVGKIRNIKDKLLDQGRLATLKYYKPLSEKVVSERNPAGIKIPKVVIGVLRDKAIAMISRYAQNEQPDLVTGLLILNQIRMQLQHYIFYAKYIASKERGKKASLEAIPAYEEALRHQNELFEAKLKSLPEKFTPDQVRTALNADPFTKLLRELLDRELPIEDR